MDFSISIVLLIVAVSCLLVALILTRMEHKKKNEGTTDELASVLTQAEQEELERKEIFRLKARLQIYPKQLKVKILFLIFGVVFMIFMVWLVVFLSHPAQEHLFLLSFIITMGTFFLVAELVTSYLDMSGAERRVYEYEISHAQDKAEEEPFTNSIKTSYKYLDRYYDQTQKQAQQGFYITLAVALFGAVLIGVGVIALFQEKITPAYITCASGAITEFISAVFFYLYNKTVTSMNSYHDKLVLSQNIAFALRIAGEMEGKSEKNEAKLAIINELVKDVNAQMMKSDADTAEPPKKDTPSDSDTPSQ